MLKRIRISGFKSLHACEVELAPLVVLLGPNAAGKSNLLEATQLLSRVVTERTLKDAFSAPLRGYPLEAFSLPRGGLEDLLAQASAEMSLEADLSPGPGLQDKPRDSLRYRVGASIRPSTGELTVADEYLVRLKKDMTPKHDARIERATDRKRLKIRQLGRAGAPREMELGLGYTLASDVHLGGKTRFPDFDLLREELSSWRMYYLDPHTAMRTPRAPQQVDHIGLQGEWIAPFLFRIKQSDKYRKHFDSVSRALRSAIPSIERLDVDLDPRYGTLDIRIWQEGIPLSSRVISEGTLRVLALCAIAANPWPGQMVAFEEPENGVHPRRIEVVASLLYNLARRGQTQVVVSTHSPTLVAAMVRFKNKWWEGIKLLRCVQEGMATRVSEFAAEEDLFKDAEIREALSGTEDEQVVQQMMQRGWLDG